MTLVSVRLIPETWIIAPIATREQILRYIAQGWMTDEDKHLDRVFPRNSVGKPIIFRMWIRSPMNQVISRNGNDRSVLDFRIVDDEGNEVNYIIIDDEPLKYRRSIRMKGKMTTEFFEYIDGTYSSDFIVDVKNPTDFIDVLSKSGRIGLLSRTKFGYGKYVVECDIL